MLEAAGVKLTPGRRIGSRIWVAALDFALDPSTEAELLAQLASVAAIAPNPPAPERHGSQAP